MIRGWFVKIDEPYSSALRYWEHTPLKRTLTRDEWIEINEYLARYGTMKNGYHWHINAINVKAHTDKHWYFAPLPMHMMNDG